MVTPEKGCYQWLPSPPRRKTEKSSLTSSVSVWAGKKTAGRCPAPPPGKSPKTSLMVRLEKAVQRAAADWEKQARAEYKKDLYDPERVKVREADRTKTDFARFVLEEWFPICIDNGERNCDITESGERIRQLRAPKGDTQEEAAQALDIDRSFYGQIDRSDGRAFVKPLTKMCLLLSKKMASAA